MKVKVIFWWGQDWNTGGEFFFHWWGTCLTS